MRRIPGFIVAGNSSGCGKTLTSLALIRIFQNKGFQVVAGKCGPDYIDRDWLARISGNPAANFDCCMSTDCHTTFESLLERMRNVVDLDKPALFLLEGAMGIFDGDSQGRGSAAEIAAQLNWPVLLLLNIKGMSQSAAAMAAGFLQYQPPDQIKKNSFLGLICTHAGSSRHQELVAAALRPLLKKMDIPLLGFLSPKNMPGIPDRHLGLVQASEHRLDAEKTADWLARQCDIQALMDRLRGFFPDASYPVEKAQTGLNKVSQSFFPPFHKNDHRRPVIAMAHDAAFSFCYADLPAMLEEMGGSPIFFSPLEDASIPHCDAIYLPGGYPQLFMDRLCGNANFFHDLSIKAKDGIPIYAECGGFMLLMEELVDLHGKVWPMAGLLPAAVKMEKHFVALGYRHACLNTQLGDYPAADAISIVGHEFHYGVITRQDGACQPLWHVEGYGANGLVNGNVWGSWLHLYPEGSRGFWRMWLAMAARGDKNGN